VSNTLVNDDVEVVVVAVEEAAADSEEVVEVAATEEVDVAADSVEVEIPEVEVMVVVAVTVTEVGVAVEEAAAMVVADAPTTMVEDTVEIAAIDRAHLLDRATTKVSCSLSCTFADDSLKIQIILLLAPLLFLHHLYNCRHPSSVILKSPFPRHIVL